ncbi:MAG TPA: hypothetical protein VNN77_00030, partial [candidate division Zixibacteria bacterium]|nr:hypothetical protein [candidate division Zixibacteria bacterium]
MKLAAVKPDDLAIVQGESIVPLRGSLAGDGVASMIDLISRYDAVEKRLRSLAETGAPARLDPKALRPPVERPSKIWAAATNYKRGSAGLEDARGRGAASALLRHPQVHRPDPFDLRSQAVAGLERPLKLRRVGIPGRDEVA